MQRPARTIVPLLLLAATLLGGCDDHILPADEGDIWGNQRIIFSDVSDDNRIVAIPLNGDATPVSLGISGQILHPPMGGHILYGALNSMDNIDLRLRGPDKDESIATETYSFFLAKAAALTFDGNDVAYVAKQQLWGGWGVYIHETDGRKTTQIDSGINSISTMMFSPDGRFLAMSAKRSEYDEEQIYIYDRSVGRYTAVAERVIKEVYPSYTINWYQWLAGGKLLYAGYDYSGSPGLYALPGEGGSAERIATGIFSCPAPSNAGTRIAFLRDNMLRIMNSDGSGQRILIAADPSRSEILLAPQWSPDDSKILLTSAVTDGNASVIALVSDVVDVGTGRRKSLTSMAYPPFWLK